MTVFIDTSAFYALLDADDRNHAAARTVLTDQLGHNESFVTTSHVLVETAALVQRRLGMAALRAFHDNLTGLVNVIWLDEPAHENAMRAVLAASRREVSLVDQTSFDAMRRRGIAAAFTFDHHFREQNFDCLP